ncbi:MAG: hypothetical protein L3K00_06485 [Thermoplasmata archaeon]|nr:hypothetical protein [Thermoplasmata archaeon]
MPKRKSVPAAPPATPEEVQAAPLADDSFVVSLREELARSQKSAGEKGGEDLAHRGDLNKRLLQDLWEVHNQFEQINVHLTVEPSQTLFATFVEYPEKWAFRDSFDFGAVKTIELHDRTPGWVGFTLRFWYYRTPEGAPHLRGIYEWCEGESYHKYTGWMRMMNQAVLYDSHEESVNLRELHSALRDLVVRWYTAHLERSPDSLIAHLKEKFPKGVTYAKESYRD